MRTDRKSSRGKERGRPRGFDEERALTAAMKVFADKGYDNTTLDDLTAAMGIHRASMYAVFGNKEALYVQAMERFSQARDTTVAACLAACPAREAVRRLLLEGVKMFTSADGPGVCFLTQGPLPASEASEQTRDYVAQRRAGIERMLRELFERAKAKGELPASINPSDLARYFAVVIQGMALQAQHGGTPEQLQGVVDAALAAWPGQS